MTCTVSFCCLTIFAKESKGGVNSSLEGSNKYQLSEWENSVEFKTAFCDHGLSHGLRKHEILPRSHKFV